MFSGRCGLQYNSCIRRDPLAVSYCFTQQQQCQRDEQRAEEDRNRALLRDKQAAYRECLKDHRLENLRDSDYISDEVNY